ncbi:MAG: hypothetical protein LC775_05990 [Acidobacteria bacterium]|nr:hypothetical protein [Acidobacteriota bacterium]
MQTEKDDILSSSHEELSEILYRASCIVSLLLASLLLVLAAKEAALAQEKTPGQSSTAEIEKTRSGSKEATKDSNTEASPSTKPQASDTKLARWFELQTATLNLRYRFIDTSAGVTTGNLLQHREAFKGRFKFDRQGNYSINAGLFTGRRFISGWDNTGLGTGPGQTNLALKQLYFSAQPIKGLEVQYGGLYIVRGESTEITTYDEDGYIVGERVTLKRPDKLFFDEISITYAYLGDINTPNINKRFHRLKQSNYHQFLISKKISKRATASADYTFQSGVETLRQAAKVTTPELRVVDFILFENYQRVDVKPDYGFALASEKAISKKFTLGGGYADIDPHYGGLNADRFNIGKRLFFSVGYQISPEFSTSTFVTRAVANDVHLPQRTLFNVVLTYNLAMSLKRTGLF